MTELNDDLRVEVEIIRVAPEWNLPEQEFTSRGLSSITGVPVACNVSNLGAVLPICTFPRGQPVGVNADK
jgi:hypothetical protein